MLTLISMIQADKPNIAQACLLQLCDAMTETAPATVARRFARDALRKLCVFRFGVAEATAWMRVRKSSTQTFATLIEELQVRVQALATPADERALHEELRVALGG